MLTLSPRSLVHGLSCSSGGFVSINLWPCFDMSALVLCHKKMVDLFFCLGWRPRLAKIISADVVGRLWVHCPSPRTHNPRLQIDE